MPRTKQVRKKSSMICKGKPSSSFVIQSLTPSDLVTSLICRDYKSLAHFTKEINTFFDNAIHQQKQAYQEARIQVQNVMRDNVLQELPEAVLKANIKSEMNFLSVEEKNLLDIRRCKTSSPVESFEFKKPKTPGQPTRSHTLKLSSWASKHSAPFKTPLMKRRLTPGSVITPKIQCNTPMTVMRRPQLGEVAVSMSGSPLLVRQFVGEDVPTVNVPLQDGRVFSIMPEDGGSFLDLPFDETTKKHLRALRAHLDILAAD